MTTKVSVKMKLKDIYTFWLFIVIGFLGFGVIVKFRSTFVDDIMTFSILPQKYLKFVLIL